MAPAGFSTPHGQPGTDDVFFTWCAQKDAQPIALTGGEGARFFTADGARWIDLGSVTWNANLGHGHPLMRQRLAAAAAEGLLAMPSADFPAKRAAARALLSVAPAGMGDGKVFLCLSGAEANENAIKMARLITGRRKVIYRDRSYHGATLAMLSYSGDPRRLPFEPGMPDGIRWDDPYAAGPDPGDLEQLLAREGTGEVAAVLLEGVVGANGVFVPPAGYFRRIREICDRAGILLIVDEVLSGFGRTGRWFAIDHDGVAPDLLTCAKGLTGGYVPGGAVVVARRHAHFFDEHVLSCGLTSYAHPLTCAGIAAAIEAYRDQGLIERAASLGERLRERLREMAAPRRFVREVRGLGLLWAIDLGEPDGTEDGTAAGAAGGPPPASPARMRALAAALRDARVHLHKRDNLVFLAPPLVIDEATLSEGMAAFARCLDACFGSESGAAA